MSEWWKTTGIIGRRPTMGASAALKARGVLLAGSVLVTAMVLGMSGVAPADAGIKCQDSMLKGLYVFTATGSTNVSPGPPEPVGIVELIRFNGDGTVDVPGGRVSVNGAIFPTVATGTYPPDVRGPRL